MKKAKIFIIIFLVILFGALIAGAIFAWPLLVKLTAPWVTLATPHKVNMFGVVFVVVSLLIGLRSWKWWFKAIVMMLVLSAISLICNVELMEIISTKWLYILGLILMPFVSLCLFLSGLNSDSKKVNQTDNLTEVENYSGVVKDVSGYFFSKNGRQLNLPSKVYLQKIGRVVCLSFLVEGIRIDSSTNYDDDPEDFIVRLGSFGDVLVKNANVKGNNCSGGGINFLIKFKI